MKEVQDYMNQQLEQKRMIRENLELQRLRAEVDRLKEERVRVLGLMQDFIDYAKNPSVHWACKAVAVRFCENLLIVMDR